MSKKRIENVGYYYSLRYKFSVPLKRLWFKFNLYIGRLIPVDDTHRAVGKTTMLIKKSIKSGMPIIVGRNTQVKLIKQLNPEVKVFSLNNIRGVRFPNGVLVDELSKDDLSVLMSTLQPNTSVSGFVQNYDGGWDEFWKQRKY